MLSIALTSCAEDESFLELGRTRYLISDAQNFNLGDVDSQDSVF